MKEFLQNKWVKLASWIMIAVGAVVLILSGISTKEVSNFVELVAGALTAIGAVIAFIIGKLADKNAKKK